MTSGDWVRELFIEHGELFQASLAEEPARAKEDLPAEGPLARNRR
ncbi:MAG: hypothetical protein ACUVQU_00010 [Candidatus Bipolaricaulia bacterium]